MLTGHVLPKLTNMSHIINKVAFGPEFPGQLNPLDGFNRITQEGDILRAYKYFLKVLMHCACGRGCSNACAMQVAACTCFRVCQGCMRAGHGVEGLCRGQTT